MKNEKEKEKVIEKRSSLRCFPPSFRSLHFLNSHHNFFLSLYLSLSLHNYFLFHHSQFHHINNNSYFWGSSPPLRLRSLPKIMQNSVLDPQDQRYFRFSHVFPLFLVLLCLVLSFFGFRL